MAKSKSDSIKKEENVKSEKAKPKVKAKATTTKKTVTKIKKEDSKTVKSDDKKKLVPKKVDKLKDNPRDKNGKITSLTDDQLKMIDTLHEQYMKRALSCEPFNKEKTITSINKLYDLVKSPHPEYIFLSSPYEVTVLINNWADMEKEYKKVYGNSTKDNNDVEFIQNYAKNFDKTKLNTMHYVSTPFFGNHDSYWVWFYRVCELLIDYNPKDLEILNVWDDITECCMWFWCFEHYCIVSDRPKQLHINSNNLLHYLEGPAIEFRDGYKMWFMNGVKVNEQIIMRPDTITLEQIDMEKNEEVKRCMIEQRTWEWYLNEINAVCYDVNEEKNEKGETTFIEALMGNDKLKVLVCSCQSTGRRYALRVEPNIKTAKEAQKWLCPRDSKLDIIHSS